MAEEAARDTYPYQLRYLGDPVLTTVCEPAGALVRVIIARIGKEQRHRVLINPVLSCPSASKVWGEDACLSIPGFQTNTHRHSWLTVSYRDEQWVPHEVALTGLSARVVQHEVNHLDGKLIVDGVSRQVRRRAERAVAKARGLS